jgi:hypothetical protein
VTRHPHSRPDASTLKGNQCPRQWLWRSDSTEILLTDRSLTCLTVECDLVTSSQIWIPPVEQMTDMPVDESSTLDAADLSMLLGAWEVC